MTVTANDLRHARSWDEVAAVITLATAEARNSAGEWTSMSSADKAKALTPAEKKAYVKSGAVPDRFKSAASQKAHDTASATASRDAKAKIAADRAARAAAKPAARPAAKPAKTAAAGKPASPPSPEGKPLYAGDLWKSGQGEVSLNDDDAAKIGKVWFNDSYEATNKYLRTGKGKADTANIKFFADKIRSSPPLSAPITVSRVVEGADKIFGPPGSVTGKTFKDKGFTSTSAGTSILGPPPPPKGLTMMKINVPQGSHVMKAPPSVFAGGSQGAELFKEYVLPPGTSFKVTSDTTDAAGNRQLVMEVTG